jgi:hypothetical protein
VGEVHAVPRALILSNLTDYPRPFNVGFDRQFQWLKLGAVFRTVAHRGASKTTGPQPGASITISVFGPAWRRSYVNVVSNYGKPTATDSFRLATVPRNMFAIRSPIGNNPTELRAGAVPAG